jgi:AAA15 family ATPase/GTPase
MLQEINIENYKLFKHLKIEGLKRVNLFAGKNNCGKTALLEALRIREAGTDLTVMLHILNQRDQNSQHFREQYDPFFNRKQLDVIPQLDRNSLQINDFSIIRDRKGDNLNYLIQTPKENEDTNILRNRLNVSDFNNIEPRDVAVFIPFGTNDYFPLYQLWSKIVLTEDEDIVVKILKDTIIPNLVRMDVNLKSTLVRLKDEKKPLPLKSLGDGAQRMLLIAIALVSAKGKMLLLDEIESGLHYSVMEKLWEIIFKYAEELDVQVFATTHSSDAIKSFTYTLEKPENVDKGVYFRMQKNRKTDETEVVAYDKEDLELSLEANLETR